MAIKIGKWYITRNNPRKLLNQQAFLLEELIKYRGIEERMNEAIRYIEECYTQPENIENFMTESEMNYTLNLLRGIDNNEK